MTLPYDISRCPGAGEPICEQCRRREPGGEWQWHIAPQANGDECPDVIRGNDEEAEDD